MVLEASRSIFDITLASASFRPFVSGQAQSNSIAAVEFTHES
jgi:hypothetical protein